MRLHRAPALALVALLGLGLSACGGGEEDTSASSGSSESSSDTSESPSSATTEDAGSSTEGMSDAELCAGPLNEWLKADTAIADKLQQATAAGGLSSAKLEELLAETDAKIEPLTQAQDEELADLASKIPQVNKDFAEAFAGKNSDPSAQTDAIRAVTDTKSALIDRCVTLSTQ